MTRPNILWICTDQQRWDTISALGFKGLKTPNIDRLAENGVAFTRAYTQSPICTPSRATFLTGMYPSAHQVQMNGNEYFPDHLKLVPKVFEQNGYHTGLIGKLHLSASQNRFEKRADDGYGEFYWSHYPYPDEAPADQLHHHDYHEWLRQKGVDPQEAFAYAHEALSDGVPTEHHQTTWAGLRASDFIERHKDKPWFLSINLFDPHPPFDPPAEYMARIDLHQVPPPIFAPSDLEHQKRFTGVDQQTAQPADPRIKPLDDQNSGSVPVGRTSHDTPPAIYDACKIKAAYFAMIELIDDMVGDLVEKLRQSGQHDNTLIIFMSDHGEMLGDHGLLYKGCRFYEGLVHVPLIISCPTKLKTGVVSDALVELVDLPGTLLDICDLPPLEQDQGKSLKPLLRGEIAPEIHKSHVVCEFFDAISFPGHRGSRGSMYFDGRYKLNLYHDAGEGELFDLKLDPEELNDLWTDQAYATLRNDLVLKHTAAMMMISGKGPKRIADF
ncbi:sulfatase family protein [Neorhizobium sp. DT-125]|uniref:sulfatase family protein n=1 Tax=Neorhizobium sp. DT-125 TaxID=3396163 RepID=UPI003F1BD00A